MTTVGLEVAAAKAAISTTLNILVNKLAPPVIEWYNSVEGVAEDLQELMDLVKEIKTWLETTGYESMVNDTSFNCLKRLRELAYDVDGVFDEFQLKAEKHSTASGVGMSEYIKKPKSFIFRCKMDSKIKKIKKRFAVVVKQRTDHAAMTNSTSSVNSPVRYTIMRTGEKSSWPNVNAASVIGRDEDKKKMIFKLQEIDDEHKIKIISIRAWWVRKNNIG
ncbi:hypothetical protein BS78_05G025600 [Paspalum vaginatum]|nr:hypothetical protein BS78_05G025600 [Paspalum vaginatum]